MNATELRVGNIVNVYQSDGIIAPWVLTKSLLGDILVGDEFEINFRDISPVPITNDILEKFGFTHVHIGGRSMMVSDDPYGRKSYTVTENTDIAAGYWCFIITDFPPEGNMGKDTVFVTRKLQFLHQLQNLIFSLCQTELNIEL